MARLTTSSPERVKKKGVQNWHPRPRKRPQYVDIEKYDFAGPRAGGLARDARERPRRPLQSQKHFSLMRWA